MEKIYFDETTFIWKKKLNYSVHKKFFLEKAKVYMEHYKHVKYDGYTYRILIKNEIDLNGNIEIKNELDNVLKMGIKYCKELFDEKSIFYKKINCDCWFNIVRGKNPKQHNLKAKKIDEIPKFHNHVDLQKEAYEKKGFDVEIEKATQLGVPIANTFIPNYTFVYYIQMPEVMQDKDGVLYIGGENDKIYYIRPEEDDLIILPGNMPHSPNNAPFAKNNRIVLAGNVGFETIKKEKTIF